MPFCSFPSQLEGLLAGISAEGAKLEQSKLEGAIQAAAALRVEMDPLTRCQTLLSECQSWTAKAKTVGIRNELVVVPPSALLLSCRALQILP